MDGSSGLASQIRNALATVHVVGKIGKKVLQPTISAALRSTGCHVDEEDLACVLPTGMPVWRAKDTGVVVPTKGRRRLDIVVYRVGKLIAFIETESDLNDLRLSGVSKRSGHYDVDSIARNSQGRHFASYNSLERMATAAFCWHRFSTTGSYPTSEQATAELEAIASDDPVVHNPIGLQLFLVSGTCRPIDHEILRHRLASLNATLICAAST
jgi:hypothetical protein